MKFSANQPSQLLNTSVYLFSDFEEISKLKFTKEEMDYVKTTLSKKQGSIVKLNRYTEFVYLVKGSIKSKSASQLKEACRILGNKWEKIAREEQHQSVRIACLSSKLSAIDFAEGLALGAYQFIKYFSDKKKREHKLSEIQIVGADEAELNELTAKVSGAYIARDLVNEPVMYLTASQLAKEAQKAGEAYGFKVDVLNKKKIETLKMGGLLAVNKGSQDPPTFTIMEYKGEGYKNKKPIVFVGKGVVYDTGGLSLKPTAGSMDSMKSDMGGAAAVIGAISAIAQAKLPVHIIGLVPATDNRPGEKAYTPGDVITMYDGSTVEVLNTDAEGRMILADALAYAKKYKPELVIDLATLTGAAAMAIGKYGIVAMGNAKEEIFKELSKAGEEVYERIAQLPFWDEYNDLLKSTIADVKNIGGREGGAITAGKFLERFTNYPYVHLDIAGPAFLASDDQYRKTGGTGVGVRLLFNYIKNTL